jgi:transcription elongation GreA/GreB family factor
MDKNLQNAKILEWQERLKQLEEIELPKAMQRIGGAAPDGDWHENAAFEDAERQVELVEVKIEEIKQLLKKLKKEQKINGYN